MIFLRMSSVSWMFFLCFFCDVHGIHGWRSGWNYYCSIGTTVVTCSNYNCSCYILLLLLLVLKGAAKKRSKAPKIQTPQMEMAELPFTWLQVMEVCHAFNCCPTSRAWVVWILGYFNIFQAFQFFLSFFFLSLSLLLCLICSIIVLSVSLYYSMILHSMTMTGILHDLWTGDRWRQDIGFWSWIFLNFVRSWLWSGGATPFF